MLQVIMIMVMMSSFDLFLFYFTWEKGTNTQPQIYYNNKHASTPQASKRKKG